MGQLSLTGLLAAGPVGDSESFPASSFSVPLSLRSNPLSFDAASGVLTQNVISGNAFAPLLGVGSTSPVTAALILYLRCDGPAVLQMTTGNGVSADVVVEVPVHGLFVVEFPEDKPLKALALKGSTRVEYFVAGLL